MAPWSSRSCTIAALTLLLLTTPCLSQTGVMVQVKMGPFVSCSTWTNQLNSTVTSFMLSFVLSEINTRCSCNFNSSHLSSTHTLCNRDDPNYPTLRTTIHDHTSYSAQNLATFVENWVLESPAVSDGFGYYTVDSSCPVYPSDGAAACGKASDNRYSIEVLAGSLIAEFVGLSIIFCLIMAVILTVYSNRLKKRSHDLKVSNRQQQKRRRLNSSVSHDSYPRSDSSRIDVTNVRMQTCSAYATSI